MRFARRVAKPDRTGEQGSEALTKTRPLLKNSEIRALILGLLASDGYKTKSTTTRQIVLEAYQVKTIRPAMCSCLVWDHQLCSLIFGLCPSGLGCNTVIKDGELLRVRLLERPFAQTYTGRSHGHRNLTCLQHALTCQFNCHRNPTHLGTVLQDWPVSDAAQY